MPCPTHRILFRAAAIFLLAPALLAQSPSSSSSSSSSPDSRAVDTSPTGPRVAQIETAGSAITLERSEPLFDLAVALNTCGYDDGLAESNPVRLEIRDEVNQAVAESEPARDARDSLCQFVREHRLTDSSRALAQYVSLSLFLLPPPELTPNADETDLPPDAGAVIKILPLLRTFAEQAHLHAIWAKHRLQYEAITDRIHDPLTESILSTNIYLHLPVSSYDGRHFLVLVEPMLAPSAANARIYSNDFIVVVSPSTAPGLKAVGGVPMDLIRHTYLHYEVEPLVYARAAAMDRLLPLLKPVQEAPLEFTYKSDIVALLTECLIKAAEDRTMDTGIPRPVRPVAVKERAELERYDAEMAIYDRKSEVIRRQAVEHQMRQGWVLTEYFYGQLGMMEKEQLSLKDNIGPMIYGMDVDRERRHDQQIVFLPEGSTDPAFRGATRRVAKPPAGLTLAELDLMKGDADAAEELANAELANPQGDHAQANYILARISLIGNQPDDAIAHFNEALHTSKDPRTLAWSHIYLGRLYDVRPDRPKALAEYKIALAVRDALPDTKAAAEQGIKAPFALPKRAGNSDVVPDDAPLDPSGKAEKEAYRPTPQQ